MMLFKITESHILRMQGLEMVCGHTVVVHGMVIFLGWQPAFCMAHMAHVSVGTVAIADFGGLTQ